MNNSSFKYISISTIWLWLALFALIPFAVILIASFLSQGSSQMLQLPFTLSNYAHLFNEVYVRIFLKSLYLAAITTLFCLVLAYPFAYSLARSKSHYKHLLLLLTIIPFWTSSLIRSYAIVALLKTHGIINSFLLYLGIIHTPLQLLYTNTAVLIGLVYNLLPLMVLPLYANIERLDQQLIEAARDLGASKFTIFYKILLPLSIPGILAGSMIVLLPAMTLFYIPDLLGGAKSMLLGNLIQDQFLFANNWPLGSAISIILTLIMGIMLWAYWRKSDEMGQEML